MNTLVVAEQKSGSLNEATARALTAAVALGAPVHIFLHGTGAAQAAVDASRLEGVEKILFTDHSALSNSIGENLTSALLTLKDEYSSFVAPATSIGKDVMPRLAAKLDVMQVSEIVAVVAPDTFDRPIYAGSAIQRVKTSDRTKVVTVRPAAFAPARDKADPAPIQKLSFELAAVTTEYCNESITVSDRPDLTSAKVVISGGRGLRSKDDFVTYISPIAERLGAAIGASRAAVDAGYAPNDFQVGQTGKIVAPDLYIAVGISGAVQHLAGMKDSRLIVAINSDEDAPIFQVADICLVDDLFKALPALEAELAERAVNQHHKHAD